MPPKRKKEGKSQSIKKLRKTRSNVGNPNEIVKEERVVALDEKAEDSEETETETDKQDQEKNVSWQVIIKQPSIRCQECNKQFRFKASFKKHLLLEHSKLPDSVQCKQCYVRSPDKKSLKEHIAKIHERELFECPECKKTFVRHAHVLRHMAQKVCHGTRTVLHPCEICGAQFSRKDNLMVHLRLQHIIRKKFSCKQCPFSTSTFSKLCVHKNKYHLEEKQKYECDHCGKVVTSRPAMCKHLEIHGEKKFACDVCGYSTFTIEVIRRHVLTHVADKPYKCEQCDRSFIQRSQLERHLVTNHGAKYTCLICHAPAASKSQLLEHMKEHGNTKNALVCPYKDCELYNKEFNTKKALRQHMDLHLTNRPYPCEVCGKTYRNSMDMKRHVASHTLERPRRCMYCVQARAYVRGTQLVKHVRKAHPQVFKEHLTHVRQVLGSTLDIKRVKQSELDSILNVLDAEAERILEGYGEGVLYGGMQESAPDLVEIQVPAAAKSESNPLMSEEELAESLNKLLVQLIDKELLQCFGWPTQSVDTVLEKVISHCGARPADRDKWTRVQRLRENTKHLFLHVIEDKNIMRMLDSHTIDQIVKHILTQVADQRDLTEE